MIFTAVMTIIVFFLKWIFNSFIFQEPSMLNSVIVVLVCAAIGGYVYLWLAFKSTLMERVLGEKVRKFARFFP